MSPDGAWRPQGTEQMKGGGHISSPSSQLTFPFSLLASLSRQIISAELVRSLPLSEGHRPHVDQVGDATTTARLRVTFPHTVSFHCSSPSGGGFLSFFHSLQEILIASCEQKSSLPHHTHFDVSSLKSRVYSSSYYVAPELELWNMKSSSTYVVKGRRMCDTRSAR